MNSNSITSVSKDGFTCLLVDDEVGFTRMLAEMIVEAGGEANACHCLADARVRITQRSFDWAVLDNRLPDGTGYEFYSQLMRRHPATVVVMITGAPELAQAIEMTRNGLFDYLTKPLSVEDFGALLQRVKSRLRPTPAATPTGALLGNSLAMRNVLLQLQQAARHAQATVLLLGETGTGKDLAARMLHQFTFADQAARTPYVALNCPNVPIEMFEAELFGSTKGAYTGADHRRAGLVETAEGGTLFLDEVAEIPLPVQSKLLRFLESREYRALGATEVRKFTGRVVAATNRSLTEEVRAGRFREDLLYRLDVFSLHLPPLREHLTDLNCIADALLSQLCQRYQRPKPVLQPQDLEVLRDHSFPGNVRELRNVLERSLLRAEPGVQCLAIDLAWLHGRGEGQPSVREPRETSCLLPSSRELTALEEQEYQLIANALRAENGGIRRAATKLGLTPQALLRRLQKWPELRKVASS